MQPITAAVQLERDLDRLMNDPDYRIPEAMQLQAKLDEDQEQDRILNEIHDIVQKQMWNASDKASHNFDNYVYHHEEFKKYQWAWNVTGDDVYIDIAAKHKNAAHNFREKWQQYSESYDKHREEYRHLPFTKIQELMITELVQKLGPKWEEISKRINKDPIAIKNRYMFLKLKKNILN